MKKIKNYPNYSITRDGQVYSHITKRFRKLQPDKNGYLNVVLYALGKRGSKRGVVRPKLYKNMKVHRLVAATFLPNAEGLPVINHKDGDKSNNRLDNLEWCTQAYNNRHARETGLYHNFGDGHYKRRRLYEAQATGQ